MTSNYVQVPTESLCEFPVCTADDVRVSLQCALVIICASAGVLRPTEMSCVRIWFHFPPALTPSARCAFSSRLCAYKRARMDASTLPSTSTGADTATQNPESCSASREFLARQGCERDKEIWWGRQQQKGFETQMEASWLKGWQDAFGSRGDHAVAKFIWLTETNKMLNVSLKYFVLFALHWLRQWDCNMLWLWVICSQICKSYW